MVWVLSLFLVHKICELRLIKQIFHCDILNQGISLVFRIPKLHCSIELLQNLEKVYIQIVEFSSIISLQHLI